MSTIQIPKKWHPEAKRSQRLPASKGAKIRQESCLFCCVPKKPCVFDSQNAPLVVICPKCGHKSWAKVIA